MAIAIIVAGFALLMTFKRMARPGSAPGCNRPCALTFRIILIFMFSIVPPACIALYDTIYKAMLPTPRYLIPHINATDVLLFPEPRDTEQRRDQMAFAISSRIFFNEAETAIAAPIEALERLQIRCTGRFQERCCADCLRRHHVSGMMQRAVDREFGIKGWRPTDHTKNLIHTLERRRVPPHLIRRFVRRVARWANRYANQTVLRRLIGATRPACRDCDSSERNETAFCRFRRGEAHAANPRYRVLMRSITRLHVMNRDLNPQDSCAEQFGASYDECVQHLNTIRVYQRMQRRWDQLDRRTGEHAVRQTLRRIHRDCGSEPVCLTLHYLYWRYVDTWYRLLMTVAQNLATASSFTSFVH